MENLAVRGEGTRGWMLHQQSDWWMGRATSLMVDKVGLKNICGTPSPTEGRYLSTWFIRDWDVEASLTTPGVCPLRERQSSKPNGKKSDLYATFMCPVGFLSLHVSCLLICKCRGKECRCLYASCLYTIWKKNASLFSCTSISVFSLTFLGALLYFYINCLWTCLMWYTADCVMLFHWHPQARARDTVLTKWGPTPKNSVP